MKKIQTCAPLPERERSSAAGTFEPPARLEEHPGIISPCVAVEVRGEEPASFIAQHRVHTDDGAPLQVVEHRLLVDRDEGLMCAFTATHARLLADSLDPLVSARGSVAAPLGSRVGPKLWEDVVSAAKQTPEECDLRGRGVWRREWKGLCSLWGRWLCQLRLEQDESRGRFGVLAFEFFQAALLSLDRRADGVRMIVAHASV